MTKKSAGKILVVEDEVVIAMRLQQRLTSMGFDVTGIAYSAEDALEMSRRLLPDLILMDIMIPGKLDGIAVAEIVKSELDIPVIFLTAFAEDKIIERAKKAEPFGYILKPFQDREIKAAIEIALYKKKMEKALQESESNFKAVVNNANDGILIAVGKGEHVFANKRASEITGYSIPELLKTTIRDLTHPDEFEKIKKRFCKIISGKLFYRQEETRIICKNGKVKPIEVSSARSKWQGQASDIVIIRDITERVKNENALRKARNELETRVKERTIELSTTLKAVERSEKELVDYQSKLKKLNKELLETNRALSVLARNIDKEKELLENKIYHTIVADVMPVITELQNKKTCQRCLADLEVLKTHLNGLFSDPNEYQDIIMLLTEQEMRVTALIKKGMTNNQIGNMLFISEHTVKTHRRNIRKKLKIQNSNINLCSYLKAKFVGQGSAYGSERDPRSLSEP